MKFNPAIWGMVFGGICLLLIYAVFTFRNKDIRFWKWWHRSTAAPLYVPEPLNIYARAGKRGLETYASSDLEKLNDPYREQLINFFRSVVKDLEKPAEPLIDREVRPKVKR